MNIQFVYNATYNYFAEEDLWPLPIPYNPDWEFYNNDIKKAFLLGKRDGLIYKNNHQCKNVKK